MGGGVQWEVKSRGEGRRGASGTYSKDCEGNRGRFVFFQVTNRCVVLTPVTPDVTDSAWQTLSESIKSSLVSGSQAVSSLLASTLKIFAKSFEIGTKLYEANKTLTEDVTKEVLVQVEGILEEGDVEEGESGQARARLNSFVGVIDTLGGEIFKDDEAVLVRVPLTITDCTQYTKSTNPEN